MTIVAASMLIIMAGTGCTKKPSTKHMSGYQFVTMVDTMVSWDVPPNVVVTSEVHFGSRQIVKGVRLNNTVFQKAVYLDSLTCHTLEFERSVFEGELYFGTAVFTGYVGFCYAEFRKGVWTSGATFYEPVYFDEAKFYTLNTYLQSYRNGLDWGNAQFTYDALFGN
ncbi:pentapeptide repeat-containing protein [Patescibacteria group bacterium]|nr:pentapeptide repeat-containing protein [Patescibacteria group bacterium]